ncbi:high choriolytic enzyme 1-like [Parambassis ranga]|uniref:Metalloendopeptidase n=1 Tax=Parambassis ranga TaxID=210632 RepID=A0A6P7HP80_9TELE|nr:high choriolytic enzyme 1-like [Parambassis ranga]
MSRVQLEAHNQWKWSQLLSCLVVHSLEDSQLLFVKMLSPCIMWSHVFLFYVSTGVVGGFPISPSPEAATPSTVSVGVLLLNGTQNVTSPSPVASTLHPPQNDAETLEELYDDFTFQEGDIMIPVDRNAVDSLWADAIVPYTMSPELAQREFHIKAAFKMISDVTCIRFQRRTTEPNYLKFLSGQGCASFVGCRGGSQSVIFSPLCSVGNLCHEIIHALGLHHEHTRSDRDQYITVRWRSITPGFENNFLVKRGNTLNLPYDPNSIMHYGPYFFSVDGSPTIVTKRGGVQMGMGQRTYLSPLDIQKLNRLYRCDERQRTGIRS